MDCPKCHAQARLFYAGHDSYGVIREYACLDCNWYEGDEMEEEFKEMDLQKLLSFVRLVASPKRNDGTYNYCREALEQKANKLLEEINV